VVVLTPLCIGLTLLPVPGVVSATGLLLGWTGDRLVALFARIVPLGTGLLWPWVGLCLGWLLLAQCHARFRRTRALVVILVVVSLGLLAFRGTGQAPRTLSLESVEIGQGDALLLRAPQGDATIVDTGSSPWSARRLVRVLSRRGVREPLHLVVTHPHGDHAGGWATLARLWPLASVHGPALANPEAWSPYAPALPRDFSLVRGDEWWRGEALFSVRWPPRAFALPDANMVSAVLRLRWQDRELWLMGDALAIQERDLLDLGDPGPGPRRRLLKPGHHGGANASDAVWIASLGPEVALVTAGRHNRFNHPDAQTLETLKGAGTRWVGITGDHFGMRIEATVGGWRAWGGDGFSVDLGPAPRPAGSSPPRSAANRPLSSPVAAVHP